MPKNSKLLEESLKMERTSLLLTISLASILTVAALSAVPNQAFAQQIDFEYRCYKTSDTLLPDAPTALLNLVDQFTTRDYNIFQAVEFCNPALKAPEGDFGADPEPSIPHLRCWALGDKPALNIQVSLTDQFDDKAIDHTVLKAIEFCHTTIKTVGDLLEGTTTPYDPSPNTHVPVHIANWICYDIDNKNTPGQPIRRLKDEFTVTGGTNFSPDGIEVGPARFLCTPATKLYLPFSNFPTPPGIFGVPAPEGTVKALDQHMKCYDIVKEGIVNLNLPDGPPTDGGLVAVADFTPETIPLDDQFAQSKSSDINRLDKLCVDVVKTTAIAGTFIPIESIAILLAGAHMTSAWIIPALIALAGVGYGIEIARKYRKDTK